MVTLPLVLLAIPSVLIGLYTVGPMLFGDFFKGVIAVADKHPAMAELARRIGTAGGRWALHGLTHAAVLAGGGGRRRAYYCYMVNPRLPAAIRSAFGGVYRLLDNKYYLDRINEIVFAGGARLLGRGLWKGGDQALIDGLASTAARGWSAGSPACCGWCRPDG